MLCDAIPAMALALALAPDSDSYSDSYGVGVSPGSPESRRTSPDNPYFYWQSELSTWAGKRQGGRSLTAARTLRMAGLHAKASRAFKDMMDEIFNI